MAQSAHPAVPQAVNVRVARSVSSASGAGPAAHRSASALLAGWAVTVGLSRIHLEVHWPTDVVGGWLYALTWLTAATALTRSKHRRPLAAPRRHHSSVTAQHPRHAALNPGTRHLRMPAASHRPPTPPDGR
ncbi:phosphatase PAP2 family protein [Streptomyces avidinii]|uniref:phosphatase PAP2 family protein n=1 Tax=Streptomyces avidinii TaxID=1895 RepID=UPI00378E3A20